MEKKNLKNFSLYFGVVMSLLGGAFASSWFICLFDILLSAFFFVLIYASYCFLEKGVLWLYDRFLKKWFEEYKKYTREKRT